MEEKKRNLLVKRIVFLLMAVFCLAFGVTWENRFCLGDMILGAVGLPAWSQGTAGLHYPAIPALIGTLVFFYLFAATTKNSGKTVAYLILGTILLVRILSFVI